MNFANVDLAIIYGYLPAGGGTFFSEAYFLGLKEHSPILYVADEDLQNLVMFYWASDKQHVKNISLLGAQFAFSISGVYLIDWFFVGRSSLASVPCGNYTFCILDHNSNILHRYPVKATNFLIGTQYYTTFHVKTYFNFNDPLNYFYFAAFTDTNSLTIPQIQYPEYDKSISNYPTPEGLTNSLAIYLLKPN